MYIYGLGDTAAATTSWQCLPATARAEVQSKWASLKMNEAAFAAIVNSIGEDPTDTQTFTRMVALANDCSPADVRRNATAMAAFQALVAWVKSYGCTLAEMAERLETANQAGTMAAPAQAIDPAALAQMQKLLPTSFQMMPGTVAFLPDATAPGVPGASPAPTAAKKADSTMLLVAGAAALLFLLK